MRQAIGTSIVQGQLPAKGRKHTVARHVTPREALPQKAIGRYDTVCSVYLARIFRRRNPPAPTMPSHRFDPRQRGGTLVGNPCAEHPFRLEEWRQDGRDAWRNVNVLVPIDVFGGHTCELTEEGKLGPGLKNDLVLKACLILLLLLFRRKRSVQHGGGFFVRSGSRTPKCIFVK